MPSSASPPRRRAPLGVLIALACVLAQLGAALHLGLVRHVRCAAHGELMHADDGHGHDAAAGAVTAVAAVEVATHRVLFDAGVPGAPPEHAHDHCQALASHAAAPDAPSIHAVAPPAQIASPALTPRRSPVALALYRLAPKASPPVA